MDWAKTADKMRLETFKFCDSVCLILEIWQYFMWHWGSPYDCHSAYEAVLTSHKSNPAQHQAFTKSKYSVHDKILCIKIKRLQQATRSLVRKWPFSKLQSSVIITQCNLSWHYIPHCDYSESDIRITTDTPNLALTGELWGVYCEDFGKIDRFITAPHCISKRILVITPSPVLSIPFK